MLSWGNASFQVWTKLGFSKSRVFQTKMAIFRLKHSNYKTEWFELIAWTALIARMFVKWKFALLLWTSSFGRLRDQRTLSAVSCACGLLLATWSPKFTQARRAFTLKSCSKATKILVTRSTACSPLSKDGKCKRSKMNSTKSASKFCKETIPQPSATLKTTLKTWLSQKETHTQTWAHKKFCYMFQHSIATARCLKKQRS